MQDAFIHPSTEPADPSLPPTRRALLQALAAATVGAAAFTTATAPPAAAAAIPRAVRAYGRPRSGLPWHSGLWTGGSMSTARLRQAERWAGRPFDFVTTYPRYDTWADLRTSAWAVTLFDGFAGRLSYGLPLLPRNRAGRWSDITSGAQDATFRTIARQLVAGGRGDSAIRVGVEANGNWFPWAVTAATAGQFRTAFRRVVAVMRDEAPDLTFWLDTSAGYGLDGQTSRLDALTRLYPGDACVDGIAMDHYDFFQLTARTPAQWARALRPTRGAGLGDAAAFARARGKGFAVPEWGAHPVDGAGDNPFFIDCMHAFFSANRDVLVFECYFNEPDPYLRNAIFGPVQLPRTSARYRQLF